MYLNVVPTPSGLSGTRFIALPTIITPRAVVRGMGVLVLRGMSGRGLGQAECAPYDIAGQLTFIAQTAMNGLGFSIEQGTAQSPDAFKANLTSQAISLCSKQSYGCPADRCAVPYDQIASLAATYAAAYTSTLATKRQMVAAGDICAQPAFLASNSDLVLSERARIGCGYGPPSGSGSGGGGQQQQQQSAAGQSLSARIENLSGGSPSSFKVGDQWRLTITGPANSPVTGSSNHNGQSNAAAPFGNTSASGVAVLTGSMAADTVGTWSEQWFVAGQPAGSLSFTVAAAAPAPSGSGSGSQQQQTNTGGGSGSTGQQQQQQQTGGGGGSSTTSLNLSSLSNQTSLAGFSLPLWGWLAIAGVGIYAVSRGKG